MQLKSNNKYDPEDYLYCSARIRALERSIPDGERLRRIAEVKSFAELRRAFEELGLHPEVNDHADIPGASPTYDYEPAFSALLRETYGSVETMVPNKQLFSPLLYSYDCHNIKSAIKSSLHGESGEHLLLGFGSVSDAVIEKSIRERDFSAFPPAMAKAAPEAIEAYSRTLDPQQIDIILDLACFEDMLRDSTEGGIPYLNSLIRVKIDLTALMTCVRLLRMTAGYEFFTRVSPRGGYLTDAFFRDVFDGGEEKLSARLESSEYSALAELFSPGAKLAALERGCDELYFERAASARFVTYGAEAPAFYIIAREYEVKNLRIIRAGVEAELPPDTIKERLRMCNV